MQFRLPHPWDGQYALPDNVMAEPPRFGTLTTRYRARRSIDAPALAAPWRTGYAYPDYVEEEPIGGGVFRTKYMPRKTVDALVPNYLGDDVAQDLETTPEMNVRSGTAWLQAAQARYGTSMEMMGGVGQPINMDAGQAWIAAAEQRYGFSLGADDVALSASHKDAIGDFGKKAAERTIAAIRKLPRSERALTLRTAVDKLEPGLWRRVVFKAKEFEARGQSANAALKQALASQMSAGLIAELVRAGQSGSVAPQSMLGAACGLHPLRGCCGGLGADEVVLARRGAPRTEAERKAAQYRYGRGTDADPWRFPPEMVDGTLRDHRIMQLAPFQRAYSSALERYGKIGFGQTGRMLQSRVSTGKIPFSTFTMAKGAVVRGKTLRKNQKMGLYYDASRRMLSIRNVPPRKGIFAKVGSALKSLGKAIIAIPKAIVEAGVQAAQKIADEVGGLACKAVSSEAGQLAAGAGAAAYGLPPQAGVAGAQVAAGLCSGPDGQMLPPPQASKFPIVPVAIGGAALLAWYFMSKRTR